MDEKTSESAEEAERETHTIEMVREAIMPTVTLYKGKLARDHTAKASKPFRFEMSSIEERERLIERIDEETLIDWRDMKGVVIGHIRTDTRAGLILLVATRASMIKPARMEDLLTKEFVNEVHRNSDPSLVLQTYRADKQFFTPGIFALQDGGIGSREDLTESLREHHRLNAD